jgi:hypothetical protein
MRLRIGTSGLRIALLLVTLSVGALAQIQTTALTGTVYDQSGTARAGISIFVVRTVKDGAVIANAPQTVATSTAGGAISLTVVRGSTVYLYSPDIPYYAKNGRAGVPVAVQNVASDTLENLTLLTSVMSAQGDTVAAGANGRPSRIAGNTTSTPKYYRQVGSAGIAGLPTWTQPLLTELGDVQITSPTNGQVLKYNSSLGRFTNQADATGGGGGGGALTVQEVDASPSVTSVETLEFNQAVGFTVTDQIGGVARVGLSAVPFSALAALTANRALVSNGSGQVSVSAVTDTELGYLSGVTSALQSQLDGKAAASHSHSGEDITSGTVDDARLSTNVFFVDGTRAGNSAATTADAFSFDGLALTSGNLFKARVPAAGFTGSILKVTDDAGSPVTLFEINAAGAITTGSIPYSAVSNKTVVNADVDAGAAIAYSKLNLSGSIVDADVNASAAIDWTKIGKTGSSLADLATRSASDLSSGTLPDGRFPATLPAISGANLTSLNASNLASGTVDAARLPDLSATYQPLDSDLTAIAALTPTNDDIIQRKAGAWTNRTVAQFKTDLGLATIATSGSASDLSAGTVPLARLSGITNTEIDAAAAIAYSKLNLTGAILNADLAGSIANAKLANSTITIAGTSTALGASISLDTITGLSTTGVVKRAGANTLAIGSVDLSSEVTGDLPFSSFVQAGSAGFVGATGAGDYSHRTPTQVTAALDAFVGDSGSGGTKGLVPAPTTGDATKYLKGDGTWATVSASPAGSTGDYQINNGGSFGAGVIAQGSTGRVTATPTAASSGSASYWRTITPADTTLAADTESIGQQFGGNTSAATVTRQFTGGGSAFALQRENVFVAPTYAMSSADTIATAATVAITGAPVAGANATISNPRALLVESGISQFGGQINTQTSNYSIAGNGTTTGLTFNSTQMFMYASGTEWIRIDNANGIKLGVANLIGWAGGVNPANNIEVGFAKAPHPVTNTVRVTNGSTGAGIMLVGSSSVTAAGQFHVASDSTSRVAGLIDGAASSTVPILRLRNNTTTGYEFWPDYWQVQKEASADPTSTQLSAGDQFAIYRKNDKLVIAYNNGGTITYLTIPLDGSTSTWTQSTSAP